MNDTTNPDPGPTREQLVAYADGELPSAARARIEAWLAEHPEVCNEVEDAGSLVRLFRSVAPPEPSERVWETTLNRIAGGLPPGPPVRHRAGWLFQVALGLSSLAAALGIFWLTRATEPGLAPTPTPGSGVVWAGDEEDVLSVAVAAEVNIVGMDPGDAERVVLGTPLLGTFDLAAPADIQVLQVQPDRAGARPSLFGKGPVPMIVVAVADQN